MLLSSEARRFALIMTFAISAFCTPASAMETEPGGQGMPAAPIHAGHGNITAGHDYHTPDTMEGIMRKMHEGMQKPKTGNVDADFIRGMLPHHQGAVDMARYELAHGRDPQARELARRIIVAQKSEIAWMQRWLKSRAIPENGEFQLNR